MSKSILENYLLQKLPTTVKSESGPQKCLEQMIVKLEKDSREVTAIKSDENMKNEELNQKNVLECFELVEATYEDSLAGERIQMYKCKFCEYRAKVKATLVRHFRMKHDENAELLLCDMCEYKTKISTELKQHKKRVHTYDLHWYHCQVCDMKTRYKSVLQTHERVVHHLNMCYSCHICKDTFESLRSLKTHLNCKHNEKFSQYECHHCRYTSMNTIRLKRHNNNKHNDNVEWHQCHFCKYKSKNKSTVKQHMDIKHLHTEQLRCDLCDYKTKHKIYLQMHIKSKHENVEDLKCHLCNKPYQSKQYLKIHIYNKHIRFFQCAYCIYTTRRKYSLKQHVMVHHEWTLYETNVEEELPLHNRKEHINHYQCFRCDYVTGSKHLLKDHINKHNEPDDQKVVEVFTDVLDWSERHNLDHKLPEPVKSELVEEVTVKENVVSEVDREERF